jgi:hypothetical protein
MHSSLDEHLYEINFFYTQELNWVQNNSIFSELVAKQLTIFGFNR